MQLFDVLEQKVVDLLREVAALRARNQDLETQLSFAKGAGEGEAAVQVAELTRALEREKKLRGDVLRRIDVLVRYLEEHGGAG